MNDETTSITSNNRLEAEAPPISSGSISASCAYFREVTTAMTLHYYLSAFKNYAGLGQLDVDQLITFASHQSAARSSAWLDSAERQQKRAVVLIGDFDDRRQTLEISKRIHAVGIIK